MGSTSMLRHGENGRRKQSKFLGSSASFGSTRSSSGYSAAADLGDLKEEDVWGQGTPSIWEDHHHPHDPWNNSNSQHTSSYSSSSSSPYVSRNVDIPDHGGHHSSSKKGLVRQQSAPMNVPDWSKILESPRGDGDSNRSSLLDDDSDGERLPPHELVAREYASSVSMAFSVCEGAGHTLKGRHMSRVRNAVLKQTGFL